MLPFKSSISSVFFEMHLSVTMEFMLVAMLDSSLILFLKRPKFAFILSKAFSALLGSKLSIKCLIMSIE